MIPSTKQPKNTDLYVPRRNDLLTFVLNFSIINLLFLMLLSLAFLVFLPIHSHALTQMVSSSFMSYVFVILALVGQVGVINLVVMLAIVTAVMGLRYLFRNVYYDFVLVLLASFLMSLLVMLLILDMSVYHLMGYHLTQAFWNVLFSGVFFQVITLSSVEWLALLVTFFLLLILEVVLALKIWQKTQRQLFSWLSISLVLLIFSLCGFSYTYYFFNESSTLELPQLVRIVPYFSAVANVVLPSVQEKLLTYPRYPLSYDASQQPLNIVMIVIDTWRGDMLTPTATPNIWSLAQQSLNFENHISGGNFTRPGIFSLMYGLTPNYWEQIVKKHQGPVLLRRLLDDHYAMAVYPSASPRFPDFVDTVFHDVPSAWRDTPGVNATQRDLTITNEFESFIESRHPSQPFFGFLFYDAVHNWCGDPQTYATPFQPALKTCDRMMLSANTNPQLYLNRYRNALHYDDQLIGNVLNAMRQRDLLKHTIVIITADHGEEFNDTHNGLWGHGSAFDAYQLHVPFVMYWPGMGAETIHYRTSHYDVVPTLMADAMGCLNASDDYSDGVSLFSPHQPHYVLVGSYGRYAHVYPHTVAVLLPGGYALRRPFKK